MNKISKTLKHLREQHDYTQHYVAEYLSISQNTYSHIERGKTRITLERLRRIAALYNMDTAELIKMEEALTGQTATGVQKHLLGETTNDISQEERTLYMEALKRLEKENNRLLQIIENFSQSLKH